MKLSLSYLLKRFALAALLLSTFITFYVVQLSTAFSQSTASLCNGRLSDNGSNLTFALFEASSDFDPVDNTPTSLGAGMSDGLFALALDAEDGDDWSPEKDAEKFKPLSASDERCVRAESRLVSQTTIFQNDLFSPFKPRSPP